ncbi:polyprenyl synthetase family protein [Archaeoglobus sp.]
MIESWQEYRLINYELERLVNSVDTIPKIRKALKHVIKAGGKRTRPLIVLLSAKLCGGDYRDVMDMALAVELIHTASLVHDDIIDRGVMRRNVKALHVEYDISLAILVGDWLISKSVELVSKYPSCIIKEFAKTGMMMSEGEVLDVYSPYERFTEGDYFRCVTFKTASLFAYGAKNSAMVVCDDEKAWVKMFEYGLNLGIAYQLVDDLLEHMKSYVEKSSEIESVTLPMIYEDKYGEKAVDMILELIRDYADRSRKALDYFEDCDAKEKLLCMIDYMTSDLIRSKLHQNENLSI